MSITKRWSSKVKKKTGQQELKSTALKNRCAGRNGIIE